MQADDCEGRAVLGRIWPDGLPPEEDALLASLPPERVELALRRLRAILEVENGSSVHAAAQALGIDRPAFYRMRQRWSASRSMRSLAPFSARAPRRLGPAPSHLDPSMVRRVLGSSAPNASAKEMAQELFSQSGGALSMDAAVRLVRAERMRLSADPRYLADRFGRVLLVDVSAISISVLSTEGVLPAVVAVVLDRASRLIIGHAVETVGASLTAQREAARIVGRLFPMSGVSDCSPEFEVVLGYGEENAVLDIARRAVDAGADVVLKGERRCGVRMLSLIGHRLGRLRLRPRATSPTSTWASSISDLSFPPMAEKHAIALIDEAVRNHNIERLAQLTGEPQQALGASDVVLDYVQEVARLTERQDGADMLVLGCHAISRMFDERS